jgi:hypothetical protein
MDVFGLVLGIPAVVVANIVYVLVARFGLIRFPRLRPWLIWTSFLVVVIAALDIIIVLTLGAVAARTLAGPAFWRVHLIAFVCGAPSLANVMILARQGMWFRHWYATAALCCLFGVFLLFLQVIVGGALYGPDGVGGPFSGQ